MKNAQVVGFCRLGVNRREAIHVGADPVGYRPGETHIGVAADAGGYLRYAQDPPLREKGYRRFLTGSGAAAGWRKPRVSGVPFSGLAMA